MKEDGQKENGVSVVDMTGRRLTCGNMLDFGLVVFQSPRLASRNWKSERPLPRGELDIALDRSYRNLTLKPLKIHDRHSSPTLGNFSASRLLVLVVAVVVGGPKQAV
jgi:hypothetical protein